MDKPVTIIREELIESMVGLINESNLPLFVIEPILKELYLEVKNGAQQQLESDKQQYQSSIAESEVETARKNDKKNKANSK